ncbi:MAG: DUF554 domain-containing protein [Candidatus Tectomicrobia bacterium]|nr:DUF554 domain-containing protein [Candidatus Tectomicrobia bacterium]
MKGTMVNMLAVVVGSLLGLAVGSKLPERLRRLLLQVLGLGTLFLGFDMGTKTQHFMIVLGSLLCGGIVGEILNFERRLEALGQWLQARTGSSSGTFVAGFVTASLVYCIGALTIVGSIQEGISGDPTLLYTKSLLDGAASVAFAASLGLGVAFAALTVLVVQGLLTLLGAQLQFLLNPAVLNELTATGGLMVVGVGLLLLDVVRIPVANLLPALVFAVVFTLLFT